MDIRKIKKLIEMLQESDLNEIEIQEGEDSVRISRGSTKSIEVQSVPIESTKVDILSENGNWLEILGCGIVNPVVLENCNIDSKKYSGLAFGLGIERIAMLMYGVNDIREFYKSNLDFLDQFK